MQKTMIFVIDQFYFLFKRFMPLQTYRYAVCGGSNLLLDAVLYFVFYHFVLQKENIDVYFAVISPHIASLFFVFPITLTTGFLLNKYITFQSSNLPGRIQFVRYISVALGALLLSYLCMKLFVDGMGVYPTPARIITIAISVVYSYILQSKFSFKERKPEVVQGELVDE